MPVEEVRDTSPEEVIPSKGKGALGRWRVPKRKHCLGSEPGSGDNLTGYRAGDITELLRGERRRVLKPWVIREGSPGKCCRCQPDSGNPTFRDERGACGIVDYGGIVNPPHIPKGCGLETLRLRSSAPHFYPAFAARKFRSGGR